MAMDEQPPGGTPPFSNPGAIIIRLNPPHQRKQSENVGSQSMQAGKPKRTRAAKTSTPKCGGKGRTGKPCAHERGWGTDHPGSGRCKQHGGSSPNGKKAAATERAETQIREAEAKARRAVAELSDLNTAPEAIENPLQALAELAGDAVRWKNIVAAYVSDLRKFRYQAQGMDVDGNETSGGEQIRGEVIVFERALARCESILVAMARLNLDERLTRISERQAELVVAAVEAALDVGKVQGELRVRAEAAAGNKLRLAVGA